MVQIITVAVISILVFFDQYLKNLILANISVNEVWFSIPKFVDICYVRNDGGPFSILVGNCQLLSVISVVFISILLVWVVFKPIKFGMTYICLSLFVAGGIGNLIDRIKFGYVIDFIKVNFIDFPVFNFADSLLTVSGFMFIGYEIYLLVKENKLKKGLKSNG